VVNLLKSTLKCKEMIVEIVPLYVSIGKSHSKPLLGSVGSHMPGSDCSNDFRIRIVGGRGGGPLEANGGRLLEGRPYLTRWDQAKTVRARQATGEGSQTSDILAKQTGGSS